MIPLGILGFRKFIGKIVFPVLLKFLFGKQYLSKRKSMKENLRCVISSNDQHCPREYCVSCDEQCGKLFTFQFEVKYFQELLVCLLICFVTFISVFDSFLFPFPSSSTPYKDFVDVSEMGHVNTAIHPYP